MKYANIDKNNKILGWYDKDIHTEIPTPNIEVTDEQWQIAINSGHNKVNKDRTTELFDFRTPEEIAQQIEDAKPKSITMRQARLALLAHNKLSDVKATIDGLPSPMKEQAKIEWEYASDVDITNPLIINIMYALGFTKDTLDDLFVEAYKL